MRRRRAATLTVMLAVLLGGGASVAHATDPVALGAEHVLDQAGALAPDEIAAAEDRLAQLSADTDVDLWVVFVDEFTNPSEAASWATETAEANGLGSNQYLLAVAVDARQYHLSADTSGPVSESEIASISQQDVQPALADEDWPGAVDAAADGLEDAVSGGGSALTWIFGIAALGAVIAVLVVMARRRKAAEPEAPKVDLAELARRAASALVATDDAVKTSEQELGFAKAQFGDAATVEFEQALAAARENLAAAFTLQQRLDDHEPDTPQQIQEWNEEILRLCEASNTALDEKAADFDALRKLEQNAPEQLTRVRELHAAADAALPGAAAELATLRSAYAAEALAPVADNPEQATHRLAFAAEQLRAAEAAIAAGDTGEAAVGIRAAEEAVAQATLLENAIGKRGSDLAAAEKEIVTLIAELEQDMAAAGTLPDTDGRVAAAVAGTRRQVDAARGELSAGVKSPLATLAALEGADTQIDAVVDGVRDAQARAQRAQQALAQQLTQAQAQVSAAEDFIVARRGAVGAEARTRAAEAGAALAQARGLAATSPEQALPLAQRANELAAQAIRYAQNDVGAFSGGGYGGYPGGGGRGDSGMMGAVLGGIVLNSLLSGGGGGRGFGGGGGSRGRSGGFGGGIRAGSFGGGVTRGRRGGSGGRF